MDKSNRKMTWVHLTYERGGNIEIAFVTERWREHRYLGRTSHRYLIEREKWVRMSCLMRVLSRSPRVVHTIYAWNGYSVCYERKYS